MSEFWHKIGCCVVAKPPPRKKRRKIDRSMIGEPTNFVHLTHIGSGEMAEGRAPLSDCSYSSARQARAISATLDARMIDPHLCVRPTLKSQEKKHSLNRGRSRIR
uniref:CRIB domain-containing protein n=1 Tax=Oncorhynchus tshawytscha TaxID=74940 RepID=A0AAZ3PG85_ONCTS